MIAIALIRINYGKHTTFFIAFQFNAKNQSSRIFSSRKTFPNFEIFYEFPANKTIFE